MAVAKQKKEEILQDLVDKFGKSKSVVFADYRGLDVANISDLRRKLRAENAEMKVAKKTLIGLAAKDTVGELDPSAMEGPVVATFSYEDPLAGIRILFKFTKGNDNLKLLGGVIDGKVVGPDVIQKYAKLPSREELLAKLIGSMNAPISGFVGIGNSLIGGIVRVLNAYKDTLPVDGIPASEPAKEEVAAPATEDMAATSTEDQKVEDSGVDSPPIVASEEQEKPVEAPAEEVASAESETDKVDDAAQSDPATAFSDEKENEE